MNKNFKVSNLQTLFYKKYSIKASFSVIWNNTNFNLDIILAVMFNLIQKLLILYVFFLTFVVVSRDWGGCNLQFQKRKSKCKSLPHGSLLHFKSSLQTICLGTQQLPNLGQIENLDCFICCTIVAFNSDKFKVHLTPFSFLFKMKSVEFFAAKMFSIWVYSRFSMPDGNVENRNKCRHVGPWPSCKDHGCIPESTVCHTQHPKHY